MTVRFRPNEFYGNLQDCRQGGVFDISVLQATMPEHEVRVHMHVDAHFVLVLSGTYMSIAQGAPEFVRAPALVYNPPGTVHRDRFLGGRGRFMAISIDPARLDTGEALRGIPLGPSYLQRTPCLRTAFSLAREMRGALDATWLESGVWDLLAATGATPVPSMRQPPSWMHLAYEAVMDSAGDTNISIGDVALAAGVHPVHLARVFREALGCSPGELLRWRRIEHACTLLRQPGRSMSDIAFAAGFVDQSHMTHAFRQRFGMPPGAWRRAMFQGYKTLPSLAD